MKRLNKYWSIKLRTYISFLALGFGLGNIWRFPYVVYDNGGGAFFFMYIILGLLIGLPLLISETLIGKVFRKSVIETASVFLPGSRGIGRWISRNVGSVAVGVCVLVLTYYSIISGWVIYFIFDFAYGAFVSSSLGSPQVLPKLIANPWVQLGLMGFHLIILLVFVSKRAKIADDRWVSYVLPLFLIMVFLLSAKSFSLPTSEEAIRFFLYPNFSLLTWNSMAQALGQLLFSLSIGFGLMVGLGSRLSVKNNVPETCFRITQFDLLVSLFAGMMVFPLVMGGGHVQGGPELLFVAVPRLFGQIEGGMLFGILFFILLYIASIGSSLGLFETIINNLEVRYKVTARRAGVLAVISCFVLAIFPIGMQGVYSLFVNGSPSGFFIMEKFDNILINWILPMVALALSQMAAYKMSPKQLQDEFAKGESPVSETLYSHWFFILKWVVPPVIVGSLVLQFVGLFAG